MVTMSDYQQQFHELRFKDRLSVADAVVLLTKAANFVAEVDPWCYPHDDSPAFIGVKTYVQSVVAQATHSARSLSQFSDTSITDFLLSPLLVKKGDRPNLVRKPKAQHTPKPRADVTAATTVARKPCSPPANLPNIQGNVSFRLSSLPLLHASSFSDPMICHSFFFYFIFNLFSHCHMYTHSNFSIFVKQIIMLRRSMWWWNRWWNRRPARNAHRDARRSRRCGVHMGRY